jgi:DNA-binding CsgD family transcriptional regulator
VRKYNHFVCKPQDYREEEREIVNIWLAQNKSIWEIAQELGCSPDHFA